MPKKWTEAVEDREALKELLESLRSIGRIADRDGMRLLAYLVAMAVREARDEIDGRASPFAPNQRSAGQDVPVARPGEPSDQDRVVRP